MLGRGFKMDEFVSKAELAQSFQRHEPFQKLLMKFRVRDKGCEVLKVKGNLLSLTGVKKTRGSENLQDQRQGRKREEEEKKFGRGRSL